MFIYDNLNDKYYYSIINNDLRIGILSNYFHFILKKETSNKLSIIDVWVDPCIRKRGIWKSLINEIKIISKQNNFSQIVSYGQFRRPIANKAWMSIENKKTILNKKSRKKDFILIL